MRRKLKNLLSNIQNSDEKTKKRWLIGASTISIILVIGLWLIYINFTTKPLSGNIDVKEPTVGFWQIFKNGLTIVFQSVKEKIKDIFLEITKSRTIIIE